MIRIFVDILESLWLSRLKLSIIVTEGVPDMPTFVRTDRGHTLNGIVTFCILEII
jgi:hypothetical protein